MQTHLPKQKQHYICVYNYFCLPIFMYADYVRGVFPLLQAYAPKLGDIRSLCLSYSLFDEPSVGVY